MKPLRLRVASVLVTARKDASMTQADLAKRSGIRQQNISRIEAGSHLNVTLGTLERLAKAMKKYIELDFQGNGS